MSSGKHQETVTQGSGIVPQGLPFFLHGEDRARYNTCMKQRSEEIRLRYLYRKMIVMGKVHVSFESARRLVGPDCAFHLYQSATVKRKSKRSAS